MATCICRATNTNRNRLHPCLQRSLFSLQIRLHPPLVSFPSAPFCCNNTDLWYIQHPFSPLPLLGCLLKAPATPAACVNKSSLTLQVRTRGRAAARPDSEQPSNIRILSTVSTQQRTTDRPQTKFCRLRFSNNRQQAGVFFFFKRIASDVLRYAK